ncbi:hypothetical protein Hanom_Chr12g01073751 [Helianthus anomalus]
MLVLVSTNMQLSGEQHALKFIQVFPRTPCGHVMFLDLIVSRDVESWIVDDLIE